MKKYLLTILALAGVLAAVSCKKDGPETPKTPSVVMSLEASVGAEALQQTTTYDLQSGQQRTVTVKATVGEIGNYTLTVAFGADEKLVAAYNTANNKSYVALPATAYAFDPQTVTLDAYNKTTPASTLTLTAPEVEVETSYLLPLVIKSVDGADFTVDPQADKFYFVLNVKPEDKTGAGTKENPYRLRTTEDLLGMEEKMVTGNVIYFKLENDIDMTSVETWAPINKNNTNDLQVNFDGNGYTIKNFKCTGTDQAGFFGVLNGTVENVTFEDAYIEPTGKRSGVIAGYCGKDPCKGIVRNVIIKNSTNNSKQQMSAMVAGDCNGAVIEKVYIENCSIKSEAGKPRFTAFILGIDDASKSPSVIRNCYVKGGEIDGNQQVAGICGRSEYGITIENCGVSAKLIGNDAAVAGILGQASSKELEKVTGCVVWCTEIKATSDAADGKYASGIVIGSANVSGPKTFSNCLYSPAIDFSDGRYPDNVKKDMDDVNETEFTGDPRKYWHGKAAATGTTAAAAAKSLGWDETIWDLSGTEPVLKK